MNTLDIFCADLSTFAVLETIRSLFTLLTGRLLLEKSQFNVSRICMPNFSMIGGFSKPSSCNKPGDWDLSSFFLSQLGTVYNYLRITLLSWTGLRQVTISTIIQNNFYNSIRPLMNSKTTSNFYSLSTFSKLR